MLEENAGYIKLFRSITEWQWWDSPEIVRAFLYLVMKANFEDAEWRGIFVPRGSFITSIDHLSKELLLSSQQIRTILRKLKSGCSPEIVIKSTNKFTMITICNYCKYNDRQQTDQQINNKRATNEQQTTNKQLTNNQQQVRMIKNDKKEIKNEKEDAREDEKYFCDECRKYFSFDELDGRPSDDLKETTCHCPQCGKQLTEIGG